MFSRKPKGNPSFEGKRPQLTDREHAQKMGKEFAQLHSPIETQELAAWIAYRVPEKDWPAAIEAARVVWERQQREWDETQARRARALAMILDSVG